MRAGFAMTIMVTIAAGSAAMAQQRELEAHEHGVGQLNVAFDGGSIVMELEAPGADIVGFEHPAKTAQDRAAIEEAISVLAKPQSLFDFPEEAGCVMARANVELEGEEHHEDHAADEHHDEAGHEDESHTDHEDESGGHTEFHAQYELNCDAPANITGILFPYFEVFPNARELEVQLITGKGANRFEVESDNPRIDLSGIF